MTITIFLKGGIVIYANASGLVIGVVLIQERHVFAFESLKLKYTKSNNFCLWIACSGSCFECVAILHVGEKKFRLRLRLTINLWGITQLHQTSVEAMEKDGVTSIIRHWYRRY